MKILIIGATGGTGLSLIRQASEHRHKITALVRSPQKLGDLRERVTVCQGDPTRVDQLRSVLPGHDLVVTLLGPPGPGPTTIMRRGARSLVDAMEAVGPSRLIAVSVAILFSDMGLGAAMLRWTVLRNVAEDSAEMEKAIVASSLDWTLVRPPRLTNGRLTGRYRAAVDDLPDRRVTASLSRPDLARFLLDTLEQGSYSRQIVGVSRA